MQDVPRPLGKRAVDFRVAAQQAEEVLTTLTTGGAKRIPIVGSYKSTQDKIRYWFQSRHPTLAFHYQLTKDGKAFDCWVTLRAAPLADSITAVPRPTTRRVPKRFRPR